MSSLPWNPVPPPCPPHPSRLSESIGFGCPDWHITLALAICFTYGNMYVSMPFSQIMLPLLPLSPKVCPLLLCLCNDTRFGFVSGSEYKTRKWKGFFLSLSVNMEGLWLSVRYRIRNVSVGQTPSWSLDSNPPPSTQNPWRMLLQSLLQSLLWQTTQWHQTTNEHTQGKNKCWGWAGARVINLWKWGKITFPSELLWQVSPQNSYNNT